MPRRKTLRLTEYADPGDLSPITPLRLQFMKALQSHPDAAAAFLRGLHANVWPIYRNLTIDADWPTIQNASPTYLELIPLREALIHWTYQLHFLTRSGAPCPWLIATAFGMIRRWKCAPQRDGEFLDAGEYMLRASELPPVSPLTEKLQQFSFSFQHPYNGMALGAYEMELRAAVNKAVNAHVAAMREVAKRYGVRVPEKRSSYQHLDWLIQNLVLARSAAQIIEHSHYRNISTASVSEAIRKLAAQFGLKPRPNAGGRPRTLSKQAANPYNQ
jgi:hypothetical protein